MTTTTTPEPESLLAEIAWLRRLAIRLCNDRDSAEDLVQETWAAAFARRWPTGLPSRAWLSTVVRNLAISRLRGESRRRKREAQAAREPLVQGQEDLVARVEAQRVLSDAVLELEEPARTILLMRFHEGLSPTDIARRLGIPSGTVRSRISRALQTLRGRLQHRFGQDGRDWRAALVPVMAARVLPEVTSSGVVGAGLTAKCGGLLIAASIAAIALFGAWVFDPFGVRAGAQGAPVALTDRAEDAVGAEVDQPAAKSVAAEDSAREVVGPLPFGRSAGWWLEGRVYAPNGFGQRQANVSIRDARGRNSTHLTGEVTGDGRAELAMGELFRHPQLLTRGLRVCVDHPDYLPARVRVPISRRQRQDGFLGKRSRIPFRVDLVPATATVTGRIRVPDGVPVRGVRVALFATDRERLDPVDHVAVDRDGRFALRAIAGKGYRVVAFLRSEAATLRPTTRSVRAHGGPTEVGELRLNFGAAIRGRVEVAQRVPGVDLRLTARMEVVRGGLALPEPEVAQLVTYETAASGDYDFLAPQTLARGIPDRLTSFTIAEQGLLDVASVYSVGRAFDASLYLETTGWFSGATSLAWAPFVDLAGLTFDGKRFEYGRLSALVDAAGRFEFRGLAPKRNYRMQDLVPRMNGRALPVQGSQSESYGLTDTVVSAPKAGVELDYSGHMLFLQFSLDGRPVAIRNGNVSYREPQRGMSPFATDETGILVLASAREPGSHKRVVEVPGCALGEFTVAPGRIHRLALRRAKGLGQVVLNVRGDDGRNVEVFHCRVERLDASGRSESIELREHAVRKRVGDKLVIRDLPAGRYRIQVYPYATPDRPDLGTFARTLPMTVELAAGGRVVRDLELLPAGFLQILAPKLFAKEVGHDGKFQRIGYRMFDPMGERIPLPASTHVYWGSSRKTAESFSLSRPVTFQRLLAPGKYVLESYPEGRPHESVRTPVVIRAGQPTVLAVPEESAK